MKDFDAVIEEALRGMRAAVRKGVEEVCDDLLSTSRDEIPYDQGDLSRSGKVTVQDTSSGAEGAVSFDTPYAVRQHEDPTLRHQDGRKAKYLGDPIREKSAKYLAHLAKRAGDALGG